MKAVCVCNGSISDYDLIKKYIQESDYIISVDGGAGHLRKMGINPDILIGDFDSANSQDLDYYLRKGINVSKFPVEKDMTDSELAIEKILELGATEVVFLGALGTRIDHSFANIMLLKKMLDIGLRGSIADEHNELYMFDSNFSISKKEGRKLSLIPITEKVTGVSTRGLKYPLVNATMVLGTSWGISNEFEEEVAFVSIDSGILLACLSRD
ncbi:thiamine pyrophosphokinase [Ruminiclostridium papyrosolvens DSM 2782]|uniref:Thiamine diphosphokinase n=1 Tax=Ruminiclostridium papyrosolvens DSM 2782 TaxID=588581 RepID=F1TDK9_9FIRM|nr:thiamine diphosphokinase [Ruminiclostridium papyrosolvens]EGD47647.1 thiamine pyrophosphokinase [Ruminiclostridium papyrosolvens DSM 2782]WES36409.1 thiamine diphosphokinase [Ruminiclostridium papyrosolvens DSM 2782]